MYNAAVETIIPTYSLEQSGRSGSRLFELTESGGLSNRQQALFLTPHRKDFYLLVFVKEGSSRHWVDMKPYTLKPDTFYFTTPQQVHLKEESEPLTGTAICFTEEFLGIEENRLLKQLPIIQNQYNAHEMQLNTADVAFMEDIMAKLSAEYQHKLNWRNGMLLAYLRVLLIYTSRLYTEQFTAPEMNAERELLIRYQALINSYYKQLHDVAAYANLLNLSAGHISEVIKEQSGKTAITHIHQRLVLEAKRLLFHTDESIKEIAFDLGFEDASYFNRFFKRLTNDTPLTYRNAMREVVNE